MAQALCYKLEGRGFEYRRGDGVFTIHLGEAKNIENGRKTDTKKEGRKEVSSVAIPRCLGSEILAECDRCTVRETLQGGAIDYTEIRRGAGQITLISGEA
jgi:hypothetical protein